ncbi:MAG: methylamine dehydrogenase accessory protein MauD [Thiohalocapsa sp.]|jgi:methylamine dehydrogenase accessory protein MauD|uniref:methylamine dehydrogenase accessory protein MauD n=1 Tax=Thiohalocapsa sp. TaxID=2497641 RepID=UPI0025E65CA3|nr:methylamine dehydrogenase accessory protein MauD [Thiohalocapsa sp.]MCG6942947.1 methylamine dehydrogenase accessory protein MauD [Thiohalocapsa sp.]
MTAVYFALGFLFVAVMALTVAFLVLARQIGVLFERIAPMGALVNDSGPRVGDVTPSLALDNLNGQSIQLGTHLEKAMLVFFVSPTCPVCKKMLPVLRSVRASEGGWLNVVLASDGERAQHERFIDRMDLADFPYVLSTELGLGFRVSRLPFAVLLDENGVIRAKGLVNNREQLESLFNAMEMGVGSIQGYLERTHA